MCNRSTQPFAGTLLRNRWAQSTCATGVVSRSGHSDLPTRTQPGHSPVLCCARFLTPQMRTGWVQLYELTGQKSVGTSYRVGLSRFGFTIGNGLLCADSHWSTENSKIELFTAVEGLRSRHTRNHEIPSSVASKFFLVATIIISYVTPQSTKQ